MALFWHHYEDTHTVRSRFAGPGRFGRYGGADPPNAQVVLTVDKQGNYSELSADGVLLGTYTFTLWQLDRNGLPSQQLANGGTLTFD